MCSVRRSERVALVALLVALQGPSLASTGCRRSSPAGDASRGAGAGEPGADGVAGAATAPSTTARTATAFTVLDRGPGEARFLTLAPEQLVFARTSGSLRVVSRSAGPARTLMPVSEPRGLALLGSQVHVVDDGLAPAPPGERAERFHRLVRLPLAGGPPEVLFRDLPLPGGLIADADRLVWPVGEGRIFSPAKNVFLDHPGGLLSFVPGAAAADGGSGPEPGLLLRGLRDPVGLAADVARFYTTLPGQVPSAHRRDVVAISRESGERQVLARGEHNPGHLRSDGQHLYWTSWRRTGAGEQAGQASTLRAVPVGGGEVRTLLGEQAAPWGAALDDRFVYTLVPTGVVRIPRLVPPAEAAPPAPPAPPRPEPVVSGLEQRERGELIVDEQRVYWSADGELRAAALPGTQK